MMASIGERHGGDAGDQDQRRVVEREHGAEQHVQQIDIAALHRDDQHAERERHEIEGGEARVLAQDRWSARRAQRQAPRRARR